MYMNVCIHACSCWLYALMRTHGVACVRCMYAQCVCGASDSYRDKSYILRAVRAALLVRVRERAQVEREALRRASDCEAHASGTLTCRRAHKHELRLTTHCRPMQGFSVIALFHSLARQCQRVGFTGCLRRMWHPRSCDNRRARSRDGMAGCRRRPT